MFLGHNRKLANPVIWIPTQNFYFGGKLFLAGYQVKQFETTNFGWCQQKQPHATLGLVSVLARE